MKPTRFPLRFRALAQLLILAATFLYGMAGAADNPDLGKTFAEVWRLHGDVRAQPPGGEVRQLRQGDSVRVGERIQAAANGEAVFRSVDQGVIALRPGSEFIAERYSAERSGEDRQFLRLITGSLRMVTGWIARLNPRNHRLTTPTATIGVRGTDHETVVLSPDAASDKHLPGTYDKVSRGATVLEAAGAELQIDAGRVGFARDPASLTVKTRALMTLLLPVLLERTPDFFVPGRFDAEIDELTKAAATAPEAAPAAAATQQAGPALTPPRIRSCRPDIVGQQWLAVLDAALQRRDAQTLLSLFSADVQARTTVRQTDGSMATQRFRRDELVTSTVQALASLRDYSQKRLTVTTEARRDPTQATQACPRVVVRSDVVEQGLLGDRPYRFLSTEEFTLEQRNGEWLAIEAVSTQR